MRARYVLLILLALAAARGTDRLSVPLGLDSYMPVPESNPISTAKVDLGRRLFFDTRLSWDGSISCATCHDPKRAFRDSRPVSSGVFGRRGNRRVPSLINRGYGKAFFWDGRLATLEEQVLQPILNPNEMGLPREEIEKRLGMPESDVARALASYVRTILSGDSPYDRYVAGDRGSLGPDALEGLQLFRGKANCVACHVGPNLTDERFHNTGIAFSDGAFRDQGRYLVTHAAADQGAFKTPTLREVARTGPYMHDGSLGTLEDVIEYYNRGGNPNPQLDPDIQPLGLTDPQKQALAAFLRALSGTVHDGLAGLPADPRAVLQLTPGISGTQADHSSE